MLLRQPLFCLLSCLLKIILPEIPVNTKKINQRVEYLYSVEYLINQHIALIFSVLNHFLISPVYIFNSSMCLGFSNKLFYIPDFLFLITLLYFWHSIWIIICKSAIMLIFNKIQKQKKNIFNIYHYENFNFHIFCVIVFTVQHCKF